MKYGKKLNTTSLQLISGGNDCDCRNQNNNRVYGLPPFATDDPNFCFDSCCIIFSGDHFKLNGKNYPCNHTEAQRAKIFFPRM